MGRFWTRIATLRAAAACRQTMASSVLFQQCFVVVGFEIARHDRTTISTTPTTACVRAAIAWQIGSGHCRLRFDHAGEWPERMKRKNSTVGC